MTGPQSAPPARRAKWKKLVLIAAGAILILVLVVIALAPTIASSIAPGRVESAANASIKGRVKVTAISVGWFSATSVGPVEVLDPEGKTAATVTVNMPASLGRIVRERWWSAKNLDVGEIDLSGALDLVRDAATGQTNLQRALEPRVAAAATKQAAPAPPSAGGGGMESVKALLKITQLDATVRDKDASGKLSPEMGVKGLKGTVNLDYGAKPMSLAAVAELSGAAVGTGDALRIKLDSSVKPKAGGGLETFKVKLDVAAAPVGLIDALANQGGALVKAMGVRADVAVDAGGTPQNATAKVVLTSDGAKADLNLALKDGVLAGVQPEGAGGAAGSGIGHLSVRSTEFLASMPQMREALAKAGQRVKVDKAPGLEITVEKLRWPLPPEMLQGTGAGAAMGKAGFRGAGLNLTARLSEMSGQVAIDQPAPPSPGEAPGDGGASPSNWKRFAVDPVELTVSAADLSQPVTITGGTKATIDGSPAGALTIHAAASGLLDGQGHLRALAVKGGAADNIDADVRIAGMSTALLQPVVAGMNLPVDLTIDAGPTLDVGVQAKADVKGVDASDPGKNLPPVDFTLGVSSANIKVDGTGRYAAGEVTTTGDGLSAKLNSAVPLARRLMTKPGQPAAMELSGAGVVTASVKNFSAPLDGLTKGVEALAVVKAVVTVDVTDLGVLPAAGAPDPAAKTAAPQPVQVSRAGVSIRLDGANPPQVDISSSMIHEKQPFGLNGQIKLGGITGGKMPPGASAGGAGQIVAFKPEGRIEIKDVPRSVLNLLPAGAPYGTSALTGTDMPSQVSRAVRESIGRSAAVTITTQPEGAAQAASIKLTTQAGGVSADLSAKLTDKSVTVSTLQYILGMDPAVVNPVLASASAPSAGAAPGSGSAQPIRLAKAFRLTVQAAEQITVPLKPGTFEPDYAKASDAAIRLSADNDIAVDNVPAGTDAAGAPRTTGLRIGLTKADLRAPLAGLAPGEAGKQRLSAAFAMAMHDGANASIGDISGTLTSTMDFASVATMAPDADVKIASIDTAVAEGIIGKPGLLSGALGDKADATLKIKPAKDMTAISVQLTAPRVSDAKIDLVQTADKVALTKPASITWRPDAAFLTKMLLTPAPAAGQAASPGGAMSVTQVAPVTISLAKFAVAMSQGEGAQQTAGPLKPRVFELDASVSVPSMAIAAPPAAAGGQPTSIGFQGIKAAVKYQPAQGSFGEVAADLTIDHVSGAPAAGGSAPAAAKASHANVHVANLADARGVLTASAAVVNLDADLTAFPTQVVDQLAHQKGVLAELLGPTIDMQATGRNVSMGDAKAAAGSVEMKMKSPRASAELKGDIRNNIFTQTGPITVTITEITAQLVRSLAGALPVIDSIEKTPQDAPGKLTAKTMTIPLNSDLAKLNGDIEIDPGVARFTTKSIFGELLDALGQKSGGAVGQRLEPFKVHADKGVLTYDKFKLPVGSFTAETRGTVDLVQRQIDVVTYAPLGSLSNKALGDLNTGIAGKLGIFDKLTQVPITTKGPLDNPKTQLDIGLFLKEQADALTKAPGKVIGNLLEDLLNKKKPKK